VDIHEKYLAKIMNFFLSVDRNRAIVSLSKCANRLVSIVFTGFLLFNRINNKISLKKYEIIVLYCSFRVLHNYSIRIMELHQYFILMVLLRQVNT
jgi:hypothetical protein